MFIYPLLEYAEETKKDDKVEEGKNVYDNLLQFRKVFEGFSPVYSDTQNTGDSKKTKVLGYGLNFYINDDGTTKPIKIGETITEDKAAEQIRLFDEVYGPKQLKNIGLTNFDNYPDELKFQLLDALFNMRGANSIKYKTARAGKEESNYYKALLQYEKDRGWENPDYDYSQIYQHADWDKNNTGWLGIRSRMRQYPQYINWNDVISAKKDKDKGMIYNNDYLDSLRIVYTH